MNKIFPVIGCLFLLICMLFMAFLMIPMIIDTTFLVLEDWNRLLYKTN